MFEEYKRKIQFNLGLNHDEFQCLKKLSEQTLLPMGELIRRAVQAVYLKKKRATGNDTRGS